MEESKSSLESVTNSNEVKDAIVPKPDVLITQEMKITPLGLVELAVDRMVVIKGATPGEYQVLESGSVICNANREVVGAIADTFGKVQEPRSGKMSQSSNSLITS